MAGNILTFMCYFRWHVSLAVKYRSAAFRLSQNAIKQTLFMLNEIRKELLYKERCFGLDGQWEAMEVWMKEIRIAWLKVNYYDFGQGSIMNYSDLPTNMDYLQRRGQVSAQITLG